MTKKGTRATTRVELTNDFHGTRAAIAAPSDLIDPTRDPAHQSRTAWEWLQHTAAQEYSASGQGGRHPSAGARNTLSRVRRELCGVADCQCGIVRP